MSKIKIMGLLPTLFLMMIGCGQKGPLYLPQEPAAQQSERQ